MARYLVLDWDHQQLLLVAAGTKSGAVTLQQAVAWPEAHSPNPALAEDLGKQLRERLKEAKIAPAPVVVCLGRERVILKELRHPPVPSAEEPALVRFQAFKELNDSPDEVVLDYIALDAPNPGAERRALAVILRREMLNTYQALCKAAGLKLAGICPRPFGAAFAAAQAGARDTAAVLTVSERWAEFCVVRNRTLLLARTVAVTTATGDALLGEIRRNLAVYAGQSPQEPVRALYVADGTPDGQLADRLRDRLAIPVHELDPLPGLGQPAQARGAFAGAAGLLHALARDGALPIDLAKQRVVRVAADPGKRRLSLFAGLVAALLLVGIGLGYSELSTRDRELEGLLVTKAELDRQLTQLRDEEKRIKVVGDWVNGEVVWLDELYDLTARFPDPKNLRLTQLAAQPLTRAANNKYTARITLKGITTDNFEPVDQLIAAAGADGQYRVSAKQIGVNTGIERQRFSHQFETRLDVEPRAAK
ncbi:MAG: hypothetical protein JNM56_31300, partial [Planctomycetia bacterium]|nr:hypothetical protein [Planctomycetia bacterium]